MTPFLRTKSDLYIFSDQALINAIFLLYIQMKRKLHERRLPTPAIFIHYNVDFLLSPPIYLKWAVSCDKHLLIVDTYIWRGGCSSISIDCVSYQVPCRTFQNRHLKNTWSTSGARYHLNFQAGIHEVCHFLFHTFHHLEWHEITIKNVKW